VTTFARRLQTVALKCFATGFRSTWPSRHAPLRVAVKCFISSCASRFFRVARSPRADQYGGPTSARPKRAQSRSIIRHHAHKPNTKVRATAARPPAWFKASPPRAAPDVVESPHQHAPAHGARNRNDLVAGLGGLSYRQKSMILGSRKLPKHRKDHQPQTLRAVEAFGAPNRDARNPALAKRRCQRSHT